MRGLYHFLEGLDIHILKIICRHVLVVQILDDTIKSGRERSGECESLVDLLAGGEVVFLLEVELDVHEHLEQLFHVDLKSAV